MKASVEAYRGIDFVRISSLPLDQKTKILSTEKEKIIKIFRGSELLNDCILYEDYLVWYSTQLGSAPIEENVPAPAVRWKVILRQILSLGAFRNNLQHVAFGAFKIK